MTLLSDDRLVNQLSLLISHTINKNNLAKNLILDGFGINLSDPEIVKKLKAGKSIELPDDFGRWYKGEQDVFLMTKQLDKPGSNHSWGDIRKKIVTIFSNQNPPQSFYEALSKVIKDPSTLLILKEMQFMNYLEQALDKDADKFLMDESDALLGFIMKNKFTFFLNERVATPSSTSKIFLLKIQACLVKVNNGEALENEALDLFASYDRTMRGDDHQVTMNTLRELIGYLKEVRSDALMNDLFLRYSHGGKENNELLEMMVAHLEPEEISRLILVFNQEKSTEFLSDSIQELYSSKLTREGKNAILWDCEMSLKRGATYEGYAWDCYEKAGHPLYTIDGSPFDLFVDSLKHRSEQQYFITKFSKIHPTGSMDVKLDTTSVQITREMKERLNHIIKEESNALPSGKRPRESSHDDMDDMACKNPRLDPLG